MLNFVAVDAWAKSWASGTDQEGEGCALWVQRQIVEGAYTSMIQFLRESRIVKIALVGFVGGMSLLTLTSMLYVSFHYAAVKPRSPQPDTGRIYPVRAQYEVVVYVNKRELRYRNFVKYDLTTMTAVSGLLFFFLGTRLGWFKKGGRFVRGPQFGNRK